MAESRVSAKRPGSDPRLSRSQTLLPGLPVSGGAETKTSGAAAESAERVYAHQMVRTDCRAQKLDAFLKPKTKTPAEPEPEPAGPSETRTDEPDRVEMEELQDDVQRYKYTKIYFYFQFFFC